MCNIHCLYNCIHTYIYIYVFLIAYKKFQKRKKIKTNEVRRLTIFSTAKKFLQRGVEWHTQEYTNVNIPNKPMIEFIFKFKIFIFLFYF